MTENLHRLEIESFDLGDDVRAVGLELLETETREPVVGAEAAAVWSALLPTLAGREPWALDFFAHLDRVRDFCIQRGISFHEPHGRALVVPQPSPEQLNALLQRFGNESFGARAGTPVLSGDEAVEGELSQHGVDAYYQAFPRYLFCGVCDFEEGFLTVLSQSLWASEIMRRARGALTDLHVEVARPA